MRSRRRLVLTLTTARLYMLTWIVSMWMVRPAIEEHLLAEWAGYILDIRPAESVEKVKSIAREEAIRHGYHVRVTCLVPVLPGIVLAKSEVSGPENVGYRSLSVVAVYGFGSRVLCFRPTG